MSFRAEVSAATAPGSTPTALAGGEVVTKRAQTERTFAERATKVGGS
jgi:hypothetical protein